NFKGATCLFESSLSLVFPRGCQNEDRGRRTHIKGHSMSNRSYKQPPESMREKAAEAQCSQRVICIDWTFANDA
ncbi:hypothetical protein Nmel_017504, partial [Mimus melanotis]